MYSPLDLGIPARRARKYPLLCPTRKLLGDSFGHNVLAKCAFWLLQLCGSVYLQASKSDVKQFMDDLAASRMLPARPDGHTYDCMTVMSSGARVEVPLKFKGNSLMVNTTLRRVSECDSDPEVEELDPRPQWPAGCGSHFLL